MVVSRTTASASSTDANARVAKADFSAASKTEAICRASSPERLYSLICGVKSERKAATPQLWGDLHIKLWKALRQGTTSDWYQQYKHRRKPPHSHHIVSVDGSLASGSTPHTVRRSARGGVSGSTDFPDFTP